MRSQFSIRLTRDISETLTPTWNPIFAIPEYVLLSIPFLYN